MAGDVCCGGFQPAMVRAHVRAWALSVMLGKRRHSSIAADNSPSAKNAVRIASASALVIMNIIERWGAHPANRKPGVITLAWSPALSTYQLLEHPKVVGWAEGFGAGWRCAADRA